MRFVKPEEFIVPVVYMNEDESCGPFLGTGFFIGINPVLVTCAHVLEVENPRFAIISRGYPGRIFEATALLVDRDYDLAILRVEDYEPSYSLPLAEDEDVILNEYICCYEYGTTVTAGNHISFSPASRMGNVTRFRNLQDRYGAGGEYMLELSFAALKGASGSPVIEKTLPHKVWGIVAANQASELLPAHIERIINERGEVEEETKFYLPQALAVHVKHLRALITRL